MKKHFWLFAILFLGAILRFYNITAYSLWHDEAFSALMVRYPWQEMFFRLGLDVHPPAYYVALRLWSYVFGHSLLSLRSLSVFFGVASIWAGYLFVKQAFAGFAGSYKENFNVALWAGLLIAINPFNLRYTTEARMYSMGTFLVLIAGYFLVKALSEQKEFLADQANNMPNMPKDISLHRHFVWNYFFFALASGVAILTHYYLLFSIVALCLYALVYHLYHYKFQFKKYIELFLAYLVIVFCFLPWLKVFLLQYKRVQAGYWIEKMNIWSIPSTFWDMFLGFARDVSKSTTQNILIAISLFCLFVFYRFVKKTQSFHKWLVVLAVLMPFIGALSFALLARLKGGSPSVYLDRYFLFAGVYFSILLAVWLKTIFPKWLSACLLVLYCALNLFAFTNFWNDLNVKNKPGMSGAVKFLKSNVSSQDKLFVGSSFVYFNLKYYWTVPLVSTEKNILQDSTTDYGFASNVRPLLFTNGTAKASEISHVTGNALLVDADLLSDFKSNVNTGDTVWLVWTNGFYANKPEAPLNWVVVDEWSFSETRPLYANSSVFVTQYKVN
jgi:mannosyltransferase